MYSNANGIMSKLQSLEDNLQSEKPDIYCITETKLQGNPPNIQGYSWETKNRSNKNGGGIAILINNQLVNQVTRIENLEEQNQEILWIGLKHRTGTLHIGTYYGLQENAPIEEVENQYSQLETQINVLQNK